MKVGLIADTHVGRNVPRIVGDLRREAYRHAFAEAIDAFINEAVDYVIHAGDLFEKRSMVPSDSTFVKNELQRLVDSIREREGKTVKVVLVRGNHDGTPENNALEYVEHPLASYLKVVGDETLRGEVELFDDGRLSVAAVGYHPYIASKFKEVKPKLEEGVSKARGERFLALHAFIKGYHELPPGVPSHGALSLKDLEDLDVEAIVCGHYHVKKEPKRLRGALLVTPGATEAMDLADEGEHGVFILEGGRARFVPVTPLHEILNVKVSSEGAAKPLSWFKEKAKAELRARSSKLKASGRMGIARLVVEGKSGEDPSKLDAELSALASKEREVNRNLLYVQVEDKVEWVKRPFIEPPGGPGDFILEALKPLGGLVEEAAAVVKDVELALEERASQKTGLLTPSDRQAFVGRWMEVLKRRLEG